MREKIISANVLAFVREKYDDAVETTLRRCYLATEPW